MWMSCDVVSVGCVITCLCGIICQIYENVLRFRVLGLGATIYVVWQPTSGLLNNG